MSLLVPGRLQLLNLHTSLAQLSAAEGVCLYEHRGPADLSYTSSPSSGMAQKRPWQHITSVNLHSNHTLLHVTRPRCPFVRQVSSQRVQVEETHLYSFQQTRSMRKKSGEQTAPASEVCQSSALPCCLSLMETGYSAGQTCRYITACRSAPDTNLAVQAPGCPWHPLWVCKIVSSKA